MRFYDGDVQEFKYLVIQNKIADVLYSILRLAQKYDIDLTTELNKKLKKN